jgi:hypothetical protein
MVQKYKFSVNEQDIWAIFLLDSLIIPLIWKMSLSDCCSFCTLRGMGKQRLGLAVSPTQ